MHTLCETRTLQMHIDDITDGHPPRFDRALVPEGRIFPRPTLGGVAGIIALEMLAGGAYVLVGLPCRNEEVQMGLLVRTAERRGIMKGIGAGQKVSGNHVNEIAHEGHVGAMPQGVGEQDLPLLKGSAPVAFLSPRGTL